MSKAESLLKFLRSAAALRRKRKASYSDKDTLVWFADLPKDRSECQSPFVKAPTETTDYWLRVKKPTRPVRAPLPKLLAHWLRTEDLELADKTPELLPECTVIVEPNLDPVHHLLSDHPEVEEAWLEYWIQHWEPWSRLMLRWQEVQNAYEAVDRVRRKLEEAEERFELVVAVGLLQWTDRTNATVKRHLITASAEIEMDAARGILTVLPSASFDTARIELDMLEPHDRPAVHVGSALEAIDMQLWEAKPVEEVLKGIANLLRADSHVDMEGVRPTSTTREQPALSFAPALVLRERNQRAFEEVIQKLIDSGGAEDDATGPWNRILTEGATNAPANENGGEGNAELPRRILFPGPTNKEQQEIIKRLERRPYVIVKGPPGTGKSQTIANLISHLLAYGERVLVTAHAPKALEVLRGLLPKEVRALCVTSLGSSRDEQRVLQESISGIIGRHNEYHGNENDATEIAALEHALQGFEESLASTKRVLRECREAETIAHEFEGGYAGTASRIARQLAVRESELGWFPESVQARVACPINSTDITTLKNFHGKLTREYRELISRDVADDAAIPEPDTFNSLARLLVAAENELKEQSEVLGPRVQVDLRTQTDKALDITETSLKGIDEAISRARRVLGNAADEILADLLAGRSDRWIAMIEYLKTCVVQGIEAISTMQDAQVTIPEGLDHRKLILDARSRLAHFKAGGKMGFLIFAPDVVRDTRYIGSRCRVNGNSPRTVQALKQLVGYLELEAVVHGLRSTLPALKEGNTQELQRAFKDLREATGETERLVGLIGNAPAQHLPIVPLSERSGLTSEMVRANWQRTISFERAERKVGLAKEPVEKLCEKLADFCKVDSTHPCMSSLAKAARERSAGGWKQSWDTRRKVQQEQSAFEAYRVIVDRLRTTAPALVEMIEEHEGQPEFAGRIDQLREAWHWASAREWLRAVTAETTYTQAAYRHRLLEDKIQAKTEELSGLMAWSSFLSRLDDVTISALNGWRGAHQHLGTGRNPTSPHWRRVEREYWNRCVPKMPAWVMPLHAVWSTIEAKAGLFDTIIVDEASQAGLEGLALMALGKRIIVVGDNMQNSPEAVGVKHDDMMRLIREHLNEFAFKDLYHADMSLFDHANRAFGNMVPLREHFRCVPDIIRFSNDLCYSDAPLVPLRQVTPDSLAPLQLRFVAYAGKTFGVITLQGHAQAELIDEMLSKAIEPGERQERKIRCGVSATFQGDQRDVMFLSMVMASNRQSQSLTTLSWQRRYNVAMSRARDQVWLFHSIGTTDLGPNCLRRKLIGYFRSPGERLPEDMLHRRDELIKALADNPQHIHGLQPRPFGSWFEVEVAIELLNRNYRVRPQYHVARWWIDLVIEGRGSEMLAVECDGDEVHGPEQRDADDYRQSQLERAGWVFVRIRGSAWGYDRGKCIAEIVKACSDLGIRPVHDESEQEPEQEEFNEEPQPEAEGNGNGFDHTEEPNGQVASPDDPFSGYDSSLAFPDPREAPAAQVKAALRDIVTRDGPLTRASVYSLYAQGSPYLQRVGTTTRAAINKALSALLRSGEFEQVDELGDGSNEGVVLRRAGSHPVKERPAGKRDLTEVPPSELIKVIQRFLASSGKKVDDEEISRHVLFHYKFFSLTQKRKKHLKMVLAVM
ncbi:MAG: AAA domain-containing protein [Flavobacteriales bacterium]